MGDAARDSSLICGFVMARGHAGRAVDLTIVTVLALPINIVAGLLDMNVGGIPLAQEPHGFAVFVALVIAFTALSAWWVFRKRD